MRTCALAGFSSEFSVLEATVIEQGRDGGSFHRSLGRLTGRCAAAAVSLATGSWMKGCGRLSHPSPLQPLQNSFCLHYRYIRCWCYFIERSILVILNACYDKGNKSMRGSFDPPSQVTINYHNVWPGASWCPVGWGHLLLGQGWNTCSSSPKLNWWEGWLHSIP